MFKRVPDRGSRHPIPAGQTMPPVYLSRHPVSVAAAPGAGGSVLVEYTLSPRALIEAGEALWLAWPAGAVTAASTDVLFAPAVAVRAKATGADGFIEIVE
ncbi:MAG: hypothetical protein AB1713_01090 [Pseudomonadota bacterium]